MTSAVAGIIDRKGGLRVVITERWRMRHHVGKKEQLFVVPNFEVQEPIPWNDIPPIVERVEKYVASTLAPVNHCGDCRACCFTLYIKDENQFQKASGQWCQHCAVDFGCKLYQQRPKVCRSFECKWLKSQKLNDRMEPNLRPDKCGAIFADDTSTNDPLIIECHGEPNADAWRWINEVQSVGYKVRKITHYFGEEP